MKGRLVDTLLIITLVRVGFGITYTLVTLYRGQPRQAREGPLEDRVATVEPVRPGGQEGDAVTPLVPGSINPLTPPVPGGTPSVSAAGAETPAATAAAGAASAGTEAEETAAESGEAPVTAPPPRTLAAGEIELERVGFSWVTGGAGACGVILEPWEHVAVSRELLADLGCGAQVTLHLDEPVAGRSSITALIGDTMNPTHSRTVNIYVGEDEPALQYGVAAGSLEAR
jgi:hypothetical protein